MKNFNAWKDNASTSWWM